MPNPTLAEAVRAIAAELPPTPHQENNERNFEDEDVGESVCDISNNKYNDCEAATGEECVRPSHFIHPPPQRPTPPPPDLKPPSNFLQDYEKKIPHREVDTMSSPSSLNAILHNKVVNDSNANAKPKAQGIALTDQNPSLENNVPCTIELCPNEDNYKLSTKRRVPRTIEIKTKKQRCGIISSSDQEEQGLEFKRNMLKKKRIKCILFFFLLILSAVSVTVVVILVVRDSLSPNLKFESLNNNETPTKTDSPSFSRSPTLSPTTLDFSKLANPLSTIIKSKLYRDPQTSQGKAFLWLMNNDTYIHDHYYDANGVPTNISSIVQRYALVTLFYATIGETWTEKSNFLNPELHECDWWKRVESKVLGVESCNDDGFVTSINLAKNGLKGSIPGGEVEALTYLAKFAVDENNDIGGIVPPEMTEMTSLVEWTMRTNAITGTIPATIGKFGSESLKIIDWSGNQITGTIPSCVGELTELTFLNLSINQLVGSLPLSFENLTNLEILNLKGNALTGGMSPEFAKMTSLRVIYLHWNDFSYGMEVFCGLDLASFISDCFGSEEPLRDPKVSCPCCTLCCDPFQICAAN